MRERIANNNVVVRAEKHNGAEFPGRRVRNSYNEDNWIRDEV